MKSIYHVHSAAINMMDRIIDDKLKIEWHNGGSAIRGVMLKAIQAGYNAGRRMERIKQKQERCSHDYTYNTTGGVCRHCGAGSLQCSSD
jgi:formamidopyrimidine-DNA glycosylase